MNHFYLRQILSLFLSEKSSNREKSEEKLSPTNQNFNRRSKKYQTATGVNNDIPRSNEVDSMARNNNIEDKENLEYLDSLTIEYSKDSKILNSLLDLRENIISLYIKDYYDNNNNNNDS